MTRDDLRGALTNDNVQAFARTVREGESRQDDLAYLMRYGGAGQRPKYFEDWAQHPKIFEPTPSGQKSSAAGAYQATWTTWNEEQKRWGWPDFSDKSQDEFFVARLIYRRALDAVIAGRFDEACRLCKAEWTSLPGGAEENAATRRARDTFIKWGGRLAGAAPQKEVKPVAPIVVPILSVLANLIPELGKLFGSGSEVANRNIAAGTLIADKLVQVTQAVNLQEAAERIQNDPNALQAAREAVAGVMLELGEAGGGGIKGARDVAFAPDGDWRKLVFSFPFVIAVSILPLIWMVVIASLLKFEWLAVFTDDQRIMVLAAVINLGLGSLIGFAFGTSIGSQRKDALLSGGAK